MGLRLELLRAGLVLRPSRWLRLPILLGRMLLVVLWLRLSMGRLRVRLRRGPGLRRRVLVMLTVSERGTEPDEAERGSQNRAAPHVRPLYAFHVHPIFRSRIR